MNEIPFKLDYLNTDIIKKNILPYYNLEKASIEIIKFKDSDKQRAVYKVTSGNTCYCLKKVYYDLDELLFVYSAIEWLYRNNINVPRILPTINRSRYVYFNGVYFILTNWVEGQKCDYDNPMHIEKSALNLATIHSVSKNFSPILGSKIRNEYLDINESFSKHYRQLVLTYNEALKHKDSFSKLFLKYYNENLNLAKHSIKVTATINTNNLTRSLCHLDYVNKNLIFDNKNNIWVIDFDKCKIHYSVHDLCYFLRRFLRRDNTNWDVKYALECLDKYESIHHLNLDDYKYLYSYLTFPQKFWKISKDYYSNILKCNKKAFYTLLSKSLERNENAMEFSIAFKDHIERKFNVTL